MTSANGTAVTATRRVRDLTLLDVAVDTTVVVACDSVGGIGPKEADTVPAPADAVGHFAARVPLLEVLACGATPVLVVDTVCVEAKPTGALIIDAVRDIAGQVGLRDALNVTGSTEDNIETRATGVGVTVIGVVRPADFLPGRARAGDVVVCLGRPLSAPAHDIYVGHPEMVAVDEVRAAMAVPGVHEALPVGSRGTRYELAELAACARLGVDIDETSGIDLDSSGGPATCVLLSCDDGALGQLRALRDDLPVTPVARLTALEVAG
jgi:hypothetical protein